MTNPHAGRPVAVAVAQGVLIYFAVMMLFAMSATLIVFIMNIREGLIFPMVLLQLAMSGVIVLFLISARGLIKRRKYGRALAVLSLLCFWSVLILETIRSSRGWHYDFSGETFWDFLVKVALFLGEVALLGLLHGGFLFLILNLSFSQNVKRYFSHDPLAHPHN